MSDSTEGGLGQRHTAKGAQTAGGDRGNHGQHHQRKDSIETVLDDSYHYRYLFHFQDLSGGGQITPHVTCWRDERRGRNACIISTALVSAFSRSLMNTSFSVSTARFTEPTNDDSGKTCRLSMVDCRLSIYISDGFT